MASNYVAVVILAFAYGAYASNQQSNCSLEVASESFNTLFYYVKNDTHFSSDDQAVTELCQQQVAAAEYLLCYLDECVHPAVAEKIRVLVRSVHYQLHHLCHPQGDPEYRQTFKDVAPCNNDALQSLFKCVQASAWNVKTAQKEIDLALQRYCCAPYHFLQCVDRASQNCSEIGQMFANKYYHIHSTSLMDQFCTNLSYYGHPNACQSFPPAKIPDDPLSFNILEIIINMVGHLLGM